MNSECGICAHVREQPAVSVTAPFAQKRREANGIGESFLMDPCDQGDHFRGLKFLAHVEHCVVTVDETSHFGRTVQTVELVTTEQPTDVGG